VPLPLYHCVQQSQYSTSAEAQHDICHPVSCILPFSSKHSKPRVRSQFKHSILSSTLCATSFLLWSNSRSMISPYQQHNQLPRQASLNSILVPSWLASVASTAAFPKRMRARARTYTPRQLFHNMCQCLSLSPGTLARSSRGDARFLRNLLF
jgi:hypothetical protein